MVHCYKNNGYNIVLDTVSGAIHVMDALAYDMVALIDEKPDLLACLPDGDITKEIQKALPDVPVEEVKEALCEICGLIKKKELFCTDSYKADIERFMKHPTVIKAACLNVAHDCNLSCRYCFASEGEYHGDRELMSHDCGKKALEFLVKSSGDRKNLEVDFFGGEPLMNLDVVKSLVSYGRQLEKDSDKHFRFTLTTNGMLLDDSFAEFANSELDNVVLSLDGRSEVHDAMRPLRGGGGSYEKVLSNIKSFVEKRGDKKHYIRGTYTRHNLDFSKDVIHMAQLGFKEISLEPVVAADTDDYAIRMEDVPKLLSEYDALAAHMAGIQGSEEEFSFFHFNIDLSGGPCVYKRLSGCGAGCEYVAIAPNGDIYPCHQFVGLGDFLLGNVYDGLINTSVSDSFKAVNVYTKNACEACFAAMYCSGGCMANAYNAHGDISSVYEVGCELERKRVECAIMLEVNRQINKKES